jgi:1-acyl-sn-glycerol-3-phosphate acyltransferase
MVSTSKDSFERPPVLIKTFNPAYELGHLAMGLMSRYKYDLMAKGVDKLPPKGPVLLGPVHRSASDPYVTGVALNRMVYYMQKAELETARYYYLGYLTRLVGAFPVDRLDPQPSTLKRARQLLAKGKVVGVFSEGTRYENEELKILHGEKIGELHESIGWLAITGNSPILPMGVGTAADEANQREVKRIVVSDPIYKQPGLPKKAAISAIMGEFHERLQLTYIEATLAAADAI